MSKYVSYSGYAGSEYDQSAIWHYNTDFDRNVTNRWLVNLFYQGVILYTPYPLGDPSTPVGLDYVRISKGTSFLVEEKTKVSPTYDAERKIAKVDMVLDYDIDVSSLSPAATTEYYLIAQWPNLAVESAGVDFSLVLPASVPAGENYVVFGTVEVTDGVVTANTTTGQTSAAVGSGVSGYSGFSGYSSYSGYSGNSGFSSFSGTSGTSGYSGYEGPSGLSGDSGTSGYSGISGYSDASGYSGYSGPDATESGYSASSGYSGYSAAAAAPMDDIWPIGSIFFTADDVSPGDVSKLNVGTWTQRATGRFIVGQKDGDANFGTAGTEAGTVLSMNHNHTGYLNYYTSASHTHTTASAPTVIANIDAGDDIAVGSSPSSVALVGHTHTLTSFTFNSASFTHRHSIELNTKGTDYYPAYCVLHAWERTA
jgi:hypothetical protein